MACQRIAETVAEVQACRMPALAEAAKALARQRRLRGIERQDLNRHLGDETIEIPRPRLP